MLAAGVIDDADTARWQAVVERLDRGEIGATLFAPMFSAWAASRRDGLYPSGTEGSDRV